MNNLFWRVHYQRNILVEGKQVGSDRNAKAYVKTLGGADPTTVSNRFFWEPEVRSISFVELSTQKEWEDMSQDKEARCFDYTAGSI